MSRPTPWSSLLCATVVGVAIVVMTQPMGGGRDKYYYLVQLAALFENGRVAYATLSLGWLAVAAPLGVLFDAERAVQGSILLFVSTLLWLAGQCAWQITGSTRAVWGASLLLATANLLTPLVTEFLAELSGLVVFAWLSWELLRRGTLAVTVVCLVLLTAVVHRSALIWGIVTVGAVLVQRIERPPARRWAWAGFVGVLCLMTLGANEVSTADGLPVLISGWSWRSTTFRESALAALIFVLWTPGSQGRAFHVGLTAVAAFAIWNPFLYSDSGFNTVGSRLALVGVWVVAVVGPVAVVQVWRRGHRVLSTLAAIVLVLVNSWPREVGTVSESWVRSRAVLDAALADSETEFSREGIHIAEHGVQFLLRLRVGLDARQRGPKPSEPVAGAVWYWVNVDGQTRRFPTGYWIAPGWVQVSPASVAEWSKDASDAERIRLVTQNWHLRPLVPLSASGAPSRLQ